MRTDIYSLYQVSSH